MEYARKVVWILGAGFSKPLGGPMLADLLSASSQPAVDAIYSGIDGLRNGASRVLREMVDSHAARFPHPRIWSDAEDLVDQLDSAARDKAGPQGLRFRALVGLLASNVAASRDFDLWDLRVAARRRIAAECCAFLEGRSTNEEKWDPYRSWAEQLGANDTILTFNYDRVLEMLGSIDIIPPDSSGLPIASQRAQVLKLHGSVDWKRVKGPEAVTRFEVTNDRMFALTCEGEEIGMATPGPSKREVTEDLGALWSLACKRLHEADAIVFVGYRFPPTDAEARGRLLGAIENNHDGYSGHHLKLHIVLGPDLGHPDVVGLEGLLHAVLLRNGRVNVEEARRVGSNVSNMRAYGVIRQPLWAEDFFTVWSPSQLHFRA
jgi:hypothetical protein